MKPFTHRTLQLSYRGVPVEHVADFVSLVSSDAGLGVSFRSTSIPGPFGALRFDAVSARREMTVRAGSRNSGSVYAELNAASAFCSLARMICSHPELRSATLNVVANNPGKRHLGLLTKFSMSGLLDYATGDFVAPSYSATPTRIRLRLEDFESVRVVDALERSAGKLRKSKSPRRKRGS